MKLKYEAYINSAEWKELKIDLLQERGCKCERCGAKRTPTRLQVHHKTYERLYNELATDLVLLCGKCHMDAHGLIKPKPKKQPKTKVKKVKAKKPKKKVRSFGNKRDNDLQARYDKLRKEGKIR